MFCGRPERVALIRVRHRTQALLLVAEGHTESEVALLFQTARHRLRAWKNQFLTHGISGLADAHRSGRPPKLTATNLVFLEEALQKSRRDYGFMGTTWTVQDLHEFMLQRPPRLAKVWQKKGCPMKVMAAGDDHKFTVFWRR